MRDNYTLPRDLNREIYILHILQGEKGNSKKLQNGTELAEVTFFGMSQCGNKVISFTCINLVIIEDEWIQIKQ